jgi:iron-sulfur cluster repair protein YtfE (RIC family)
MGNVGGGAPRPDVNDMFAVHGVFKDTLGAAPGFVAEATPDDQERVGLVANYYENVLSFLEAHHDGEEKLVFPLLRERCATHGDLLDQMEAEHHEAIGLLTSATNSLAAWPGGDAAAQAAVAKDLEALRVQLVAHLENEEQNALPLCGDTLSLEEWGALPGHGLANFHGDKIWLILGLIRERMTEGQRAEMMAHMPPPARDMWTGFGEQAFRDYSAQLHAPVENTAR